jgi:hypothetical protein
MQRTTLIQTFGLVLTSWAIALPASAQEATELWRLDGFAAPESVSYDPGTGTLFVSNLAVDVSNFGKRPAPAGDAPAQGAETPPPPPPAPEAPKGYITQVSLDGKILKERFVDNLAAPGGNTVVDGALWQLAGNLLKIDIASATVVETFVRPPEIKGLLPDVAIAADGRAFVTSMGGAIYLAENGTLVPWLEDPSLAGSNGIVIDGKTIYVAAGTAIKAIDLDTKQISDYGAATPLETLDDLRMIPTGMLVSSGGKVVEVRPEGAVAQPFESEGVAGVGYAANENIVVVTRLVGGEVIAYKANF